MIVVDEYHYGESTYNFREELIAELDFEHIIYVSGTAFRDIQEGRFDSDQIYSWDYIDEQIEKKKGSLHHQMMPTMITHLMSISPRAMDILQAYSEPEGFNMAKLISVKKDQNNNTILDKEGKPQLMDEGSLQRLLEQIAGTADDRAEYSPLRMSNLKHTFWVLDKNTDGIIAMANLMKKMNFYKKGYYIIPATGNEVSNINVVKETISKANDENKGTITLSCVRFKEGVTIPQWNGVLMLDGGSSLEEYLQAIFRCQSPDEENDKQECHVFDFNPQRCLKMRYKTAENRDKGQSAEMSKVLTEYLKYAPILDNTENEMRIDDAVNRIIDTFRASMAAKTKFSNPKNINEFKIDDEVKQSLTNVAVTPKEKKELQVNDSGVPLGKTKIRHPVPGILDGSDDEEDVGDKNEDKKYILKIRSVLSNIPEYLFNTSDQEESIDQILKGDDNLFLKITGIHITDFAMWIEKGVINKTLLRRDIVDFNAAEKIFTSSHPTLEQKDKFFNQHFNMRAAAGQTNSQLVNEMLDKLPKNIWKDPSKTFCDPVMGTGTFLVAIKERLMQNLTSIPENKRESHIINNMIFGSDKNESKFNIARKLLGPSSHIINEDSFKHNWNMKFDVIVGNPPYHEESESLEHARKQSGQGKIWVRFIKLGINEMLNDSGLLLFVTPNNWMFESNNMKEFFKKHLRYANISQYVTTRYFPKIGHTFSYYILGKTPQNNYKIQADEEIYDNLLDNKFLPKKGITSDKINIFSKIANKKGTQLFEWFREDVPGITWHKGKTTKFKYQIVTGDDEWYTDIETPKRTMNKVSIYRSKATLPEFDNYRVPSGAAYISYFKTKKEAENVAKILNTHLYKFIINNIRSGMALVSDVNYVPFPNDINKSWTDQDIYMYFNINKNEQKYINPEKQK